jgi:hypothetical protein
MRLIFKHNTSGRTKQILTRKWNHKRSRERRKTRRSGMRRSTRRNTFHPTMQMM